MRNLCLYIVLLAIVVVITAGCGGTSESTTNQTNAVNSCVSIDNPAYHINYYEMCGNAAQPITTGSEQSVALWFEIDSPSSTGKVWVDDLYLERSDRPGVNLISNASFSYGLWPAKNNALCQASDLTCTNIVEFNDFSVWSLDSITFYSSGVSAMADMSKLPIGWQSHIFQLINLPSGIPANITFRAHAMVKIEGNLQVRLGVDFRNSDIQSGNPRDSITSAINGIVIRGTTSWRRIDLR